MPLFSVEYEIPPLRAIYTTESVHPTPEAAVDDLVARHPRAVVRKIKPMETSWSTQGIVFGGEGGDA